MSKIKSISLWTVWAIFAVVLICRLSSDRWVSKAKADVIPVDGVEDARGVSGILTWDVFGYYLYLPAYFIYDDIEHLEFAPILIDQYRATETFYQANQMENGNKVMKLLLSAR